MIKAENELETSPCKHIKEEINTIEEVVYRGDNYSKFSTKEDSKNRTLRRTHRKTKKKKEKQ